MKSRAATRFGLLDAMILVAAIAIGLAWARFQAAMPEHLFTHFQANLSGFGEPQQPHVVVLLGRAWEKFGLTAPVMATTGVGLLIVQLRRPSRRRLDHPGTSACVATTIVLVLSGLRFLVAVARWWVDVRHQESVGVMNHAEWWYLAYDVLYPAEPGIAIVACWLLLALSGRMRCERSVADRLGRLVAVYWITAMIFHWVAGQF